MTSPAAAPQKPRSWLGIALLILLGSAVFGGLPAFVTMYLWRGESVGTPLDAARARQIVTEQAATLAELLAVPGDAVEGATKARRQELATRLGALAVRVGALAGDSTTCVVFRRHGSPGETREERLQWVSATTALQVRSGGVRLGAQAEELGNGWWWVAD
ncbi:MAG: hypothetical protein JNK15_21185 [Planctomycetes bacterium]|nr:hypothetical protein [Planctomycetota bacterium]